MRTLHETYSATRNKKADLLQSQEVFTVMTNNRKQRPKKTYTFLKC